MQDPFAPKVPGGSEEDKPKRPYMGQQPPPYGQPPYGVPPGQAPYGQPPYGGPPGQMPYGMPPMGYGYMTPEMAYMLAKQQASSRATYSLVATVLGLLISLASWIAPYCISPFVFVLTGGGIYFARQSKQRLMPHEDGYSNAQAAEVIGWIGVGLGILMVMVWVMIMGYAMS